MIYYSFLPFSDIRLDTVLSVMLSFFIRRTKFLVHFENSVCLFLHNKVPGNVHFDPHCANHTNDHAYKYSNHLPFNRLFFHLFHLEFVAHTPDGFDIIAFVAYFIPKFLYMRINRSCISEIIIIPHIVQDFLSGQRNSLIFYEISQSVKFLETQVDLFAIDLDHMCRFVNLNSACIHHRTTHLRRGCAKYRLHTGHQNLRAERFGNIFVNPKLKSLQLIPFFRPRCQHNNRHLGGLTDFS